MPAAALSPLTRFTRAIILAGAAVTIGIMAHTARPWERGLDIWLLFPVFAAIATAPGWVLWWMAGANDPHRASRVVIAVAATLIIVASNVLYILVWFVDRPDAQAGFVFVSVPLLQAVLVTLAHLAVVAARRLVPPTPTTSA